MSDNIPIFTEQEKYNEAVLSSVKRVEVSYLPAQGAARLSVRCCYGRRYFARFEQL